MSKGVSALLEACVICDSKTDVEMHHVKSLKLLKPLKDTLKNKLRAIRRKQIPLCRVHHFQIHNNNWRNPAIPVDKFLNDLRDTAQQDIS